MGFKRFGKIASALSDEGKYHYQYVYKTALPAAGTAGFFIDANQSSGIPVYNAFAGSALTFTPLTGTKNQGVYTGTTYTGSTKHLLRMQVLTTTGSNGLPSYTHLCDYLGFIPLIDADSTDQQDVDNTLALTRYTDGKGVRAVLIATAPMTTTASVTMIYTNQAGVTGRSVTFNVIAAANIGVCATGAGTASAAGSATPFVKLADGDTGIRAVESITFAAGAGGFLCLALVKPLATIAQLEASVPVEKMFGYEQQMLPEIKEGAYLNFLIGRGGTAAVNFSAELIFVNS